MTRNEFRTQVKLRLAYGRMVERKKALQAGKIPVTMRGYEVFSQIVARVEEALFGRSFIAEEILD